MTEPTTGDKGSSGTLSRVAEKGTERRRYDLTGSIPQWIASFLLAMIGCLILLIWNSMDRRVQSLEKQIETVVAASNDKNGDVLTLKARSIMMDQMIAEIKANQKQTSDLLINLATEVRVMSAQLQKRSP